MAGKKDKAGIESLRTEVQALSEGFFALREQLLSDAAVQQSERQQGAASGNWQPPQHADVDAVAALFAALGQPQRLRIVMLLAEAPATVQTIVSRLELKTTGAAYHHLNVLSNQGIVAQPQRGTFALNPDAAGQVEALLASVL